MKKINSITFITSNFDKVEWSRKYLSFPIEHLHLDLTEIQSLDLREITAFKAKEAYRQLHKPVLVEDTFLSFQALGKLPPSGKATWRV